METEDYFLIGTSLIMVAGVIFLGGTLAVGIITGAISAASLGILLMKVKKYYPRIWTFICKHPLFSDITISSCLFLLIASNTATGVIAGAAAGLFSSIGINFLVKLNQGQHERHYE
jgi:hypothetical protein